MQRRLIWTQSNPAMQHIKIIGDLEHFLNNFENDSDDVSGAVKYLRDGLSQLVELHPFLEKGCWDNQSSRLVLQSEDQILGLIFDQNTTPDKINDLLYKVKAQLDKRSTRRVKRIKIQDAEIVESGEIPQPYIHNAEEDVAEMNLFKKS